VGKTSNKLSPLESKNTYNKTKQINNLNNRKAQLKLKTKYKSLIIELKMNKEMV